ncbi:terpenoid synthase [Cubamyces sp. BRFM 1775]|nr:terpenoid synthase [Cubamyces sp. BRFM 1775]
MLTSYYPQPPPFGQLPYPTGSSTVPIPPTPGTSSYYGGNSTGISAYVSPKNDTAAVEDIYQEIQSIMLNFLQGCRYENPTTPPDEELRHRMLLEVQSWEVELSPKHAQCFIETGSHFAETAYRHTSPEHRFYAARYTAYFLYADDLGQHHIEALKQFPRRFMTGEPQLDPILDRLVALVRCAHELWTDVGTDAIIIGTLEAISAFHLEFSTHDMVIKPGAVRYPDYLRLRSGIDPPFIAFVFMRGWRSTAESYLQLIPDMEYWIGAVNDVLSFYKEVKEQETTNYVHLRAAAERLPPLVILRKLADEIVETTHRLDRLVDDDVELAALWRGYVQRFLEFSVKAPRYRLAELGLTD